MATRFSEMILKVWTCLLACEWDALTQVHSPNGTYLQASGTFHLCLCPNGLVLVQLSLVKKDRNPHRSVVLPECWQAASGLVTTSKSLAVAQNVHGSFHVPLNLHHQHTKWDIGEKLKDVLIITYMNCSFAPGISAPCHLTDTCLVISCCPCTRDQVLPILVGKIPARL